MKRGCVWFFLSCRRYLRKVSFLLILLVLPAATFFIRRLEKTEGQEVRIAVCVEEAGGDRIGKRGRERTGRVTALEAELVESLVQGKDSGDKGLFRFYRCRDEEQVKAQVASRKAECGYVISADLRKKLDEQDYKRCIRVYSAPSTVLAELSTEVVFASLMELYDREIFLDYVTESQIVRETVQAAELGQEAAKAIEVLAGELYDKWLNNGSTFRFEYRYQNQRGRKKEDTAGTRAERGSGAGTEPEAVRVFPVRGIVAVYLLLAGLYSAVMLGGDERKGLFLPLSPGRRLVCRLAVLGAPVFLAALSAFGALKTGGCLTDPGREIRVMGLYVLAVCGFSYGVKVVCRKPQAVCCLIPLFLVGSLVFAPVFVDIRQFFPALGWAEKLFLPSYYLRAF